MTLARHPSRRAASSEAGTAGRTALPRAGGAGRAASDGSGAGDGARHASRAKVAVGDELPLVDVDPRHLIATPAERRRRRRRFAGWTLLTLVAVAVAAWAIDRAGQPPSPEQVADRIHEAVEREAVAQSGDRTLRVGELSCVELEPGRGNCLADTTSTWRPTEGSMIAVAYEPHPDSGELTWTLRLP